METSYKYLLDLALILISTKFLGMFTRKLSLPQVVGALLAGIILGPACFGFVHETDFIKHIAEIGVIVIMFSAGLRDGYQRAKKFRRKIFYYRNFRRFDSFTWWLGSRYFAKSKWRSN